jgi:hypothetical protein
MRRIDSTESQPTSERRGPTATTRLFASRPPAWRDDRRLLVPIALPKRFVEGVAWDEV